jgi:signal transduction histidine kinase
MNNLRNNLFLKLAIVVFIIVALFEGALIVFSSQFLKTHLKDKLIIIATEIGSSKFHQGDIFKLQHTYKIYPLFIKIISPPPKNISVGFTTKKIKTGVSSETLLTYNYIKNNQLIQVSTLMSVNGEKIQIIKIISMAISMFIYLTALLIGYKFIDEVANNIEESFNRLKLFNSNVSHELKTPLTVIKGEIEVALMNGKCDEKLLKSILEEINYINDITDKLLFLTQEKSLSKQHFEEIYLEDIIIELFEKYVNKIEIDLDIQEDTEFKIKGDKTLLKTAISNLIENSIKYGATKIVISLKKEKNKIILTLKDNGIGIPKEKLPFIFDEFYRVDESRNKKVKGFGLGLAIVKSIITLHNGKIQIFSEGKNKGVEIKIEFVI